VCETVHQNFLVDSLVEKNFSGEACSLVVLLWIFVCELVFLN
jgi:hypothetical protein